MREVICFRTFLCQLDNLAARHVFAFEAKDETLLFCTISELTLHTRGRHVSRYASFAPNLLPRKTVLLQITDKLLVVVFVCAIYQARAAVYPAHSYQISTRHKTTSTDSRKAFHLTFDPNVVMFY
jgi:hypothetical protein